MKQLLFTKEELQEFIKKYKIYEIAELKSCSTNTVRNYLKIFNITTPKGFHSTPKSTHKKRKNAWSDERKKKMSERFSGENNPFYKKQHSRETRKKMRENHADFTGDNNPFKTACIKNPKLIENCKKIKIGEWAKLDKEKRYTRNKRVVIGDISNYHWTRININAKSRDLEFDITPEYIWNLWIEQQGKCKLTGVELNLKSIYEITASLDRIDSRYGYVVGNVQWIHKLVNWMKNSLSNNEFINICYCVVNNVKQNSELCEEKNNQSAVMAP